MQPWLLVLLLRFLFTRGASQNPKIYVDVDCIDHVVSLPGGFEIYLPQNLLDTQLLTYKMPTLYTSVIPLESNLPEVRNLLIRDGFAELHNPVAVTGLTPNQWYYVCFEFENQHRSERTGNFSTTCQLHRTLPQGNPHEQTSVIKNVKEHSAGEDFLEITLDVDVFFSVQLDIYLENGPLVQSYIVGQPRTLRVLFTDLTPGYNYGRVCVMTHPEVHAYTAMGRTVQVDMSACYLGDLRTEIKPVRERSSGSVMVVEQRQETQQYVRLRNAGARAIDYLAFVLVNVLVWML